MERLEPERIAPSPSPLLEGLVEPGDVAALGQDQRVGGEPGLEIGRGELVGTVADQLSGLVQVPPGPVALGQVEPQQRRGLAGLRQPLLQLGQDRLLVLGPGAEVQLWIHSSGSSG